MMVSETRIMESFQSDLRRTEEASHRFQSPDEPFVPTARRVSCTRFVHEDHVYAIKISTRDLGLGSSLEANYASTSRNEANEEKPRVDASSKARAFHVTPYSNCSNVVENYCRMWRLGSSSMCAAARKDAGDHSRRDERSSTLPLGKYVIERSA